MEKMARILSFKASKLSRLNKTTIMLLIILGIASFLRLYRIGDYITFLGDEGRDMLVVRDIIEGISHLFTGNFSAASDKLTLLGPTASVGGFFMGPIYYYLITPFLWLFQYDPVGPSIFVALLGVVTVWLVYKIGTEFFNPQVGLIGAFLYAISPVVIVYSRASWNPNVMPFFTLVTLYTLYHAVRKNSALFFIIAGILFGIDLQLHYTELFLGCIIVFYVVLMRIFSAKPIKFSQSVLRIIKDGIFLFIGFLIGFSPFLAFEIRHEFVNIKSISQFIFQSGETGASVNFFQTLWNVIFRLFGRLLVNFPLPNEFHWYTPQSLTVWFWSIVVLLSVTLLHFALRWKESIVKTELFQRYSLFGVWFLLGVFFFGLYQKPIYDYYFEFLFPLPFFMTALMLSDLYNNRLFYESKLPFGKVTKFLAIIVVLVLAAVNIYFTPVKNTPNKMLDQTKRIAQFVVDKAEGKPFNFAIISGNNSDHAYLYFMTLWGKRPIEIQDYEKDPQRESVTDQLFVVCESLPCFPLKDYVWKIAFFGKAEIAGRWTVVPVEIYKLTHFQGDKFIKFSPSE